MPKLLHRNRTDTFAFSPPHPGAVSLTPVAAAVELRDVTRTYGDGVDAVHALDHVSITFVEGTFSAVMGASGSGKSTLLQSAAGLDTPTSGSVILGGTDLGSLTETDLTKLRRAEVGFVFQGFNLLPSLTVLQNVQLPLRLAGERPNRRRAEAVLDSVGLSGHGRRRPSELSGGQQQRVAIARALITDPAVIFADEPTGALDPTTAMEILDLLRDAVDQLGATVVMVTHDPVAASFADRVVFLADGSLAGQIDQADAATVAHRLRELVSSSRGATS
jgi:putative ABC transport system ATP-binding protein